MPFPDKHRFHYTSKSILEVQWNVYELETFLDIHPFPRFKDHGKYIFEETKKLDLL
ncbi:MAG: hypothetical protein ACW981_21725 [Candidatus Hodarchaeales archaeon]|jgi:hypothetical protein